MSSSSADAVANRPPSVGRMFLDRVAATPAGEAYRRPVGAGWESITWGETGERVQDLAAGLLDLGVQPEERVALISATRVEWVLADFAVLCAGAATTTVYPSTNPEDVAYIVADSGAVVAFAEDDTQIAKLRDHRDQLPALRTVVTFDGHRRTASGWSALDELAARGRKRLADDADLVRRSVDAIRPEQLATLIYTSRHDRPAQGRPAHPGLLGLRGRGGRRPRAARRRTTCSTCGCRWRTRSARCCSRPSSRPARPPRSTAGSTRSSTTWRSSRPTFMAAVPRIFEKVHSRVVTMAAEEGGARKKIFDWAIGVGREHSKVTPGGRYAGGRPSRSSTPSPTGWCSPSCGRGSGASCGSSCAAAPRCRRTSPSSSTPPAS